LSVRLESVRRKSGGRIHLTPRIPRSGPVTTLCGQTLGDGAYAATEAVADCANCIRRSRDQSRVSSAFFESEEGSELLRLSLEQARGRQPHTRPSAPAGSAAEEKRPVLRVVPRPVPMPESVGELVTDGFRLAGAGVWRSPGGVIVRMSGPKRDRFAELVFEGSVVATRGESGLRLRAGDVEVASSGDGFEVRIRRPSTPGL
jgi:hypothetical protein